MLFGAFYGKPAHGVREAAGGGLRRENNILGPLAPGGTGRPPRVFPYFHVGASTMVFPCFAIYYF